MKKTLAMISAVAVLVTAAFGLGYFLASVRNTVPIMSEGSDMSSDDGGGHSHGMAKPKSKPVKKKAKRYACSMLCTILPEPGQCPVCGMVMVEQKDDSGDGPEPVMTLSERAMKLAELRTAPVLRQLTTANVRMVGKLVYDETKLARISADFPGRIDRLHVDYVGMQVRKGDHIADLFSPELIVLQREYQLAKRTLDRAKADGGEMMLAAANRQLDAVRVKLRSWRLEEAQLSPKGGGAFDRITITAPIGGTVTKKYVMSGDYFKTSQTLFMIADLKNLWLTLDAYESDLKWLHYGQTVEFEVEAFPGDRFSGVIAYVHPEMDEKTRTVKVRVNVTNTDGKLRPGMFVHASVLAELDERGHVRAKSFKGKWLCPMHPEVVKDEAGICDVCEMNLADAAKIPFVSTEEPSVGHPLTIPASAPLITGKRAIVYVEEKPGVYHGREIHVGPRAGDRYVVLHGLKEGEKVVTNGAMKLDSEMQIRAKLNMMSFAGEGNPQTVCPVMGLAINKELYADVKGKRIYVCCPPCIDKLKADPDPYIRDMEMRGIVIETALKAIPTATVAKMKPQTICPVMGNAINKEQYADVKGKRIYVCCPPCIDKIKADPDKYLKIMKDQGVEPENTP